MPIYIVVVCTNASVSSARMKNAQTSSELLRRMPTYLVFLKEEKSCNQQIKTLFMLEPACLARMHFSIKPTHAFSSMLSHISQKEAFQHLSGFNLLIFLPKTCNLTASVENLAIDLYSPSIRSSATLEISKFIALAWKKLITYLPLVRKNFNLSCGFLEEVKVGSDKESPYF